MTEEKRPAHRPLKGGTPRDTPLRMKIEAWVKSTIVGDAQDGESQADVITRWAGHFRDTKENA